MQSHRSLPLSLSLLVLPLFVACGEADDGDVTDPTPTTTGTEPVVPGPVNPEPTDTSPPVVPVPPPTSTGVEPTPPPATVPPIDTTPPPAVDNWTEVYGIFQASCGGGIFCHSAAQMPPQLVGDEATVKGFAETNVVKIVNRTITLKTMPGPPAGPLPQEQQDAIQAWANTLTP